MSQLFPRREREYEIYEPEPVRDYEPMHPQSRLRELGRSERTF